MNWIVYLAAASSLVLAADSASGADFDATQVSGPGAPPLLLIRDAVRHEDLAADVPRVTYNVYRKRAGEGFRCISSHRRDATAWPGDTDDPAPGEAFWYTVNADDLWGENDHGSQVPITERCACSGPSPTPGQPDLTLRFVVSGLDEPLHVTAAPGDRSRLFVVERAGLIRVVRRGELLADPFLNIRSRVANDFERGLLALAFHPGYASNGRFFVHYTAAPDGETVISEYAVSANPDRADVASERIVYTVAQPSPIHNGGALGFGPHDGLLYFGLGDGGPGCEPNGRAQDLSSPYGAILRLDVDAALPYAIPADNPLAGDGDPQTLDELWVWGLRNPWRFGFDSLTGDLLVGDVGQGRREEVDHVPAGSGGLNFGWPCAEGELCDTCTFGTCSCPADPRWIGPVVQYDHSEGCSIIGGEVYRGCRMPDRGGMYIYTDVCTNLTRSFVLAGGRPTDEADWTADFAPELATPVSWGYDARGEIYVVNSWSGTILRLEPR